MKADAQAAGIVPAGEAGAPPAAPASAAAAASGESSAPVEQAVDVPRELVRRALRLLAEKRADVWVNKGEIWPMVKRLDPTFELNEHGFTSFPGMLKALPDLVEIRKGEHDQQVRLKQGNNPCSTKSD